MNARFPSNVRLASRGLRLALGTAFLSAVAGRFGLWGARCGNWRGFLQYAAEVNWYLPAKLIPVVAVAATALELTYRIGAGVRLASEVGCLWQRGVADDLCAGHGLWRSEIAFRLFGVHSLHGSAAARMYRRSEGENN